MDPRTGIAFANVFAFQEIRRVLEHDYVGNGEFGCYVGQEEGETDEGETQS